MNSTLNLERLKRGSALLPKIDMTTGLHLHTQRIRPSTKDKTGKKSQSTAL